jgi:heme/copper-type cytochrome/quinol oxidase subunit 2
MLEDFNILTFFIIFFGFFAVIVAIVMIATVFMARGKKKSQNQEERVIEKETVKEIVMIPCVYCGSLNPQTALFCSTCGAQRKA